MTHATISDCTAVRCRADRIESILRAEITEGRGFAHVPEFLTTTPTGVLAGFTFSMYFCSIEACARIVVA